MKQCLILIMILSGSLNAWGALGDKEDMINSDKIKLKASNRSVQRAANYSVHELSSPIRTIKEYVSADGTVFAVSWRGANKPDLSVLLGKYYEEYQAVDSAKPKMRSRQPVAIKTSRIVVHKDGHMRDIRGVAYIEGQLPEGVRVEDLK